MGFLTIQDNIDPMDAVRLQLRKCPRGFEHELGGKRPRHLSNTGSQSGKRNDGSIESCLAP